MTEITIRDIANGWMVTFKSDIIGGACGEHYAKDFDEVVMIVKKLYRDHHKQHLEG